MILELIFLMIRAEYIAVDLGSQYLKMAESTLTGDAKMVSSLTSKIITPSAAAIRPKIPLSYPIKNDDLRNIEVRYGTSAINILKKNSSLGYAYLPRVIGRNENETEFGNPDLSLSSALFSLMFMNYMQRFDEIDGMTIVLPFYWTRLQMRQVSLTCDVFKYPLISLVDDFSAITMLYGATRSKRFADNKIHVLFVDVGFSGVRAYSAVFRKHEKSNVANETSAEWSEKTGGYYFVKKIAAAKNLPFHKAEKYLINAKDPAEIEGLLFDEIDEMKKVVEKATLHAKQSFPNENFDELQLIGGASQFPFVAQAIKDAANVSSVKRDFNANEAFALGGVYSALAMKNYLTRPFTSLIKRPSYSMNLNFNESHHYCTRGGECKFNIFEKGRGAKKFTVTAPKEELPEGINHVLVDYSLKNFSVSESTTFKFDMSVPDPIVESVSKCANGTCKELNFSAKVGFDKYLIDNAHFLDDFLVIQDERKRTETLISSLDSYLIKVGQFVNPSNDVAVESKSEASEEIKEKYRKYSDLMESGKVREMTEKQINEIIRELRLILKSLQ